MSVFRLAAVLGCILVLGSSAAWAQKPRQIITLDRIVAVVNDEVITRNELEQRVNLAVRQLQQQGTPLPPRDVLEKQLLERLITDRVQLQLAKETGLRVDDIELDRAIGRISADNKISLQQLRAALEKDGVPFTKFREDIRNEIIIARLREREVNNKIVITESEIDNFISTQQTQQGGSDDYNLSHILVVVPESAGPEQIQQRQSRAEEALTHLKKGMDFRQVAATFSDAPDALEGGLMGWREASRLPTLFLDALKPMKVGELSPVLRSPNGFHILRLNDRRGGQSPVIVQQTHARHILIKTNELISENEARSRLNTLKERLDNKADFSELARVHSEDTSAPRGGDLGWISPGDTVPDFERAMDALKPGQISDPVRSPFGWHLIQVLKRRDEDMSKERLRLAARQALRARKSDESYQEWVRQLRDQAFIDIRSEDRLR
ncbi:MAG: peptidylprolyl isomerase [Burkholderiales bacterium]|nr:peptidylprolyl isomerase [Burkholderiales bacterium]